MDPTHETTKKADPTIDAHQPPGVSKTSPDDDRLGRLAGSQSSADEARELDSTLDDIGNRLGWFDKWAVPRVEDLRREVHEEDEPRWFPQLALSLLEVALGAGAAAAGVRLAQKFARDAGEVKTELVKMIFEQGINAGIAAGRNALAGGKSENVIDPFFNAQREGVLSQSMSRQSHFTMKGRHRITSLAEAKALQQTCSETNMKNAAEGQYDASRDAWLSYLAQTTFGQSGKRDRSDRFVGPTTTNMSTQRQRDRDNAGAEDWVPEDAPSIRKVWQGEQPGVLAIGARLPAIMLDETTTYRMYGQPKVEIALLGGVNETIRSQYRGRPLSELAIPRHLECKVESGTDFEINLDERGKLWGLPEGAWLHHRPLVGHPEKSGTTGGMKRLEEGLKLLLDELVAPSIDRRA